MGFLEQALAVTTDRTERAELLERAGSAASAAGLNDRGRSFLDQAIELHRSRGDRVATCRATAELGRVMLSGRDTEAALEFIASATEEHADLAEEPAGVALWAQLARAQFLFARPADAVATADGTLALAERLDLVPVVADLLVTKGSALANVGRPREGLGTIETGRSLAESVGLTFTILRATLNSTGLAADSDPRAGLAAARRGLDLAVRLGLPSFVAAFRETVGGLSIRTGDWEAGIAALNEGLESVNDGDRIHLAGTLTLYRILRGEPSAMDLGEMERLLEGEKGTLLIVYQRDPAIPWQAGTQDGPVASGTTGRIVVDLAPVLRGGVAYAIVDSPVGPQRFAVPLGLSGQLLDALYAPLAP